MIHSCQIDSQELQYIRERKSPFLKVLAKVSVIRDVKD